MDDNEGEACDIVMNLFNLEPVEAYRLFGAKPLSGPILNSW